MKSILIHLGLPKTATTTLQHNVLQKLHDVGVINFLGKNLDYCDQTGGVKIINYSGKFIRDAVEEKITIEEARNKLKSVLLNGKLNVVSDEGLMLAYPDLYNLSLNKKFSNLEKIFEGYDVKVVLTLRSPVEYFYSLYVQLYPDFYSHIKEMNSFEKYANNFLKTPDDILYESFFYGSFLPVLNEKFTLHTLFFEDLEVNKDVFFDEWSSLLDMDKKVFSELFESKHVNKKQKISKSSKKMFSLKFIECYFKSLFKGSHYPYRVFKSLYYLTGVKKILNRRIVLNSVHNKPSGKLLEDLRRVLVISQHDCKLLELVQEKYALETKRASSS